jgi:hypothetical protein
MGAAGVAIILMKERHVAEAFERAGITSAEKARAPEELGVGMHGLGWRRLVERAIVREASPGKWYLDVPSWVATRRLRRRRSLVLFVLVIVAAAFIILNRPHP